MTDSNKPVNKKKFLYLDKFTDYQIKDNAWKKLVDEQIAQANTEIFIISVAIAAIVVGNIIMWVFFK